ncbi:MAG: 2-oxoacid:acceptor oxidoreductase family protein [Chloroflexi bacterium]|nr:2-oxoacid:acceptor oxidoreductase family protein [Chloroflexota bacterium]
MKYDIFFTGVGGQGILTIGELLAEAARDRGLPANFYPSKGMAQRGGFVKAQLRLGRADAGPNIPQRSADLAVSLELSETLKAIPYLKPGGEVVVYADVWAPTAVALGKAPYPTLEQVAGQVSLAGARWIALDPASLPRYQGEAARPNIYVLGALIGRTALSGLFSQAEIEAVIQARFPRSAAANLFAFRAGLEMQPAAS